MSAWKLVEAVVDAPADKDATPQSDKTKAQGARNGGGRRNSKGEGRGGGRKSDVVDSQTVEYYANQAVQQIYYIFSEENLCMDTYVRSYMDEAGYVPLAVLCSYPNVAYFNVPSEHLLTALKAALSQPTSILEMDEVIGTLKLKEKWQMWLMPNATGGRGLPLYSLQATQAAATEAAASPVAAPAAASSGERRSRSSTEELSAKAPEFTPKA